LWLHDSVTWVTFVRVQEVRHQTVEDFRPLEINRMPGLGDRLEFSSANKIREGHRGSRRENYVFLAGDKEHRNGQPL